MSDMQSVGGTKDALYVNPYVVPEDLEVMGFWSLCDNWMRWCYTEISMVTHNKIRELLRFFTEEPDTTTSTHLLRAILKKPWLCPTVSEVDSGKISYIDKSYEDFVRLRFVEGFGVTGNTKYRTRCTFGRFIRRRLGVGEDLISDADLAAIGRRFEAHFRVSELECGVVSGVDIGKMYVDLERNFRLGSCMSNDTTQTELYQLNPDVCRLFYWKQAGGTPKGGRALLWSKDGFSKNPEGKISVFLDRQYGNNTSEYAHKWLEENGYELWEERGAGWGNHWPEYKGEPVEFTLKHRGTFPYIDTFYRGDYSDDHIVLNVDGNDDFQYTDGSCSATEKCYCSYCSETVDPDDYHTDPDGCIMCESCWDERCSTCADCGETVWRDDMIYVEGIGDICDRCRERGDYFYCDSCCEWHSGSDYTYVESTGETLCPSCFDSGQYGTCRNCGEVYRLYNLKTDDDGDTYCDSCYPSCAKEEPEESEVTE